MSTRPSSLTTSITIAPSALSKCHRRKHIIGASPWAENSTTTSSARNRKKKAFPSLPKPTVFLANCGAGMGTYRPKNRPNHDYRPKYRPIFVRDIDRILSEISSEIASQIWTDFLSETSSEIYPDISSCPKYRPIFFSHDMGVHDNPSVAAHSSSGTHPCDRDPRHAPTPVR